MAPPPSSWADVRVAPPWTFRKQPSGLSPPRFHNALAFLSKYPLKDTHFDLFAANVKLAKVMGPKGALITTMELPTPAGVVDVTVTPHPPSL